MSFITCWRTQRDLTALADGELSPRRAAALRDHLGRCGPCGRLHREIESAVKQHTSLLRRAGVVEVDVEPLLRKVVSRLDFIPQATFWWIRPPVLAAAAAASLVVAFLAFSTRDSMLIVLGLQDPPKVVATKTDFFLDYPLFEHLEVLERLDAVEHLRPPGAVERFTPRMS
jgi:anti-sigma factor RsiW